MKEHYITKSYPFSNEVLNEEGVAKVLRIVPKPLVA